MRNLLEFILNRIVDHPEDVQVSEEEIDNEMVYTIHLHPDDIARVIGKNGSVINSIRSIAKVRSMKEQIRARIQLAED